MRKTRGAVEGEGREEEDDATATGEVPADAGWGAKSENESPSTTLDLRLVTSPTSPATILGTRFTQSEVANGSKAVRAASPRSHSSESDVGSSNKDGPRSQSFCWNKVRSHEKEKKPLRTKLASYSSTQSCAAAFLAADPTTLPRLSTVRHACLYCIRLRKLEVVAKA